jgi:hypothetical protein
MNIRPEILKLLADVEVLLIASGVVVANHRPAKEFRRA